MDSSRQRHRITTSGSIDKSMTYLSAEQPGILKVTFNKFFDNLLHSEL
jgi:hypothetical protein